MRLRYLRSADRDLRDIHAFIAERNEVAADRFIAAVHTKIARLAAPFSLQSSLFIYRQAHCNNSDHPEGCFL